MHPGARYVFLFVLSFTILGAASWVAIGVDDVAKCRISGSADVFLAYCNSPKFGDFEHGAYYYDLEPEAVRNLRKAKVLFLGDSRTQFAFSTEATKSFFRERHIPYYVLGFSYTEASRFAQLLINRFDLAPRLLVINAEPFFGIALSPPAQSVVGGGLVTRLEYLRKKISIGLQPFTCGILLFLCAPPNQTIFRSTEDGEWIWENTFAPPTLAMPIEPSRLQVVSQQVVDIVKIYAAEFMKNSNVSADCVALVATPTRTDDFDPLVIQLSQHLKTVAILPQIAGLATIDNEHLNKPSAERWSAAVLSQLAPMVQNCIGAS